MHILWIILVGFAAGIIARHLLPGPNNPSGFVLTTPLGIAARLRKLEYALGRRVPAFCNACAFGLSPRKWRSEAPTGASSGPGSSSKQPNPTRCVPARSFKAHVHRLPNHPGLPWVT